MWLAARLASTDRSTVGWGLGPMRTRSKVELFEEIPEARAAADSPSIRE